MIEQEPFAPATDPRALRRAYGTFPSGVVAVCADDSGISGATGPVGLAASAFTTVSLDPPLASLCIRSESQTWPMLRDLARIGVSVLSSGQGDVCRALAGPPAGRFAGLDPIGDGTGALFVPAAAAHLACSLYAEVPAGDHTLVLLRIEALRSDPSIEPLVFHVSTFRALESRRGGE